MLCVIDLKQSSDLHWVFTELVVILFTFKDMFQREKGTIPLIGLTTPYCGPVPGQRHMWWSFVLCSMG